jgi:hypothetical protein
METRMKIRIEPHYISNMPSLDTASERALLKAHLPRAKKIATAQNLVALLAQHNGTARVTGDNYRADRWFDVDPTRTSQIHPVSAPPEPVALTSPIGILTQELTLRMSSTDPFSYQSIKVYIPLDPEKIASVAYNGTAIYATWGDPMLVYSIEVD